MFFDKKTNRGLWREKTENFLNYYCASNYVFFSIMNLFIMFFYQKLNEKKKTQNFQIIMLGNELEGELSVTVWIKLLILLYYHFEYQGDIYL